MKKEKQYNFLKIMCIILSFGLVFGINALSMIIVKDESSFKQIMLGNFVEIISLVGVLLLWAKILPRIFPSINDFCFKRINFYQIMMILGISILSLMLLYRFLYLIRGGASNVAMVPVVYNKTEFLEDMMASIHAILIAPIIEETSFRLIPASIVQTKKNKIVALSILTIAFALLHPRNVLVTLFDGIVYCVLLLVTRNPIVSILCHSFNNFLKTIAMALAYFNIIDVYIAVTGGTIILFNVPVTLISIVVSLILILFAILKLNHKSL